MKPFYFIFNDQHRTNWEHHHLKLHDYYVTVVAIDRENAIKIFKKEFASHYLDSALDFEDCIEKPEFVESDYPDGEYKEYKQTFNSVGKAIGEL